MNTKSSDRCATCLCIVDVQHAFISPETKHVAPLVEVAQGSYDCVVIAKFVNPHESLYRSLLDWHRCAPGVPETALAFAPRTDAFVIERSSYSALTPELAAFLRDRSVVNVDVCGIDTDACVMQTAFGLFEIGIVPRVLSNLCASAGGLEIHQAALSILRRNLGVQQVV